MIMIEEITPIIITYNEEANIARTLDRLTWARRIVVIDSGSTDANAACHQRFLRIIRNHVHIGSDVHFIKKCRHFLASQIDGSEINEHEVVVRSARYDR